MTSDDISLNISTEPPIKKSNGFKSAAKDFVVTHHEDVEWENIIDDDERQSTNPNRITEKKPKKKKSEENGKISSVHKQATEVVHMEITSDIQPISEQLFSTRAFKDFGAIHPHLVSNLEQYFGISQMMQVQQLTLPVLLAGKDALVKSQTGSGKTLAYALPILQTLQKVRPKLSRTDGIQALVILPTRELALQTYECFIKLVRAFAWLVPGLLVGGEKRKSEKARLRKGINILVGTPGRLLDHVRHTASFDLSRVSWLVIDEADMLCDLGYEKDVASLLEALESSGSRRQSVLLSATLGPGVERLAGLSLAAPARIDCSGAEDLQLLVVPDSLQQTYLIVPPKLRLVSLAAVVIRVCQMEGGNKTLVFAATQDMVDYLTELLPLAVDSEVEFFKLHGNMSQADRTEVFNSFRSANAGVLLSTDVASRGLDMPHVDWIVQYNAPTSPAEYVHRVGRTARVGAKGSAVLFLAPSETQFLQWLANKGIRPSEDRVENFFKSLLKTDLVNQAERYGGGVDGAATALQHLFENAVVDQSKLHDLACKAYTSWVRFYASYPKEARTVFDFKALHLGHHAKSFALRDPPTAIGGIGRPKGLEKKGANKKFRTAGKPQGGGKQQGSLRNRPSRPTKFHFESQEQRTRRLVISEYESGLGPVKKMKTK